MCSNNNNNNNNNIPSFGNMVVNLSIFSFDPLVYSLMEKALDFSLAPRKISVEDIIFDIEYGINDLRENTKDIII